MNAATRDIIQRNKLPQPPDIVWRVQYTRNQDAVWSSRLAKVRFGDDSDFVFAKHLHYNANNRKPTPFLSTFASEDHASAWGREKLNEGAVWIYSIDTNGLDIFSTPREHELLIWGQIPRDNVLSQRQISWRDGGNTTGKRQRRTRGGRKLIRYKRTGLYTSDDEEEM